MYASNYFETAMLNVMRGTSITAPAKVYLALYANNPGDTGAEGTEVSYTGYARQEITFSTPAEYASGLAIQNVDEITFAECPTNYGNVTYIGVLDSATGGNMLLYGQLDVALNLQNGVTPIFRAGSVKWIWSGNLGTYYRTALMNTLKGVDCAGFSPYIGLCNGDPEGSGSEFTGQNYQRIALTMSTPEEQANGTTMCQNVNELLSNESTGYWGILTHIAIYDASSDGHIYAVIPTGSSSSVQQNTAIGFHAGSVRFSVN